MDYLHLSNDELIESFESANPWFVGLYMETFYVTDNQKMNLHTIFIGMILF